MLGDFNVVTVINKKKEIHIDNQLVDDGVLKVDAILLYYSSEVFSKTYFSITIPQQSHTVVHYL